MNPLVKTISLIGCLLLAGMAVYSIWFDAPAPEDVVKAFVTLVIVGLLVIVFQSMMKPSKKPKS